MDTPKHAKITRDIDGLHLSLPATRRRLRTSSTILLAVAGVSIAAIALMAAAVFGVGYLTGQLPVPGESLSSSPPAAVALLVTAGLEMLAARPVLDWLQSLEKRDPRWTLSLRHDGLIARDRAISFDELRDILRSRAGGLTLVLDSGEVVSLVRAARNQEDRALTDWLHATLSTAWRHHQPHKGSQADVPEQIVVLSATPEGR